MAKRLNEFCTSKRIDYGNLYLYAWATYKRGDVPDTGELEYINKRVTDKYPDAELQQMRRTPVPTVNVTFTEVLWEFEWVVYNYEKKLR
jgi:hypothetical protein